MALDVDRLKAPLFALIRAALPRVNYCAPRISRVVTARTDASGGTALDVVPEDPAFPPMGGVPLFHGLPGTKLTLSKGTRVLVEFSEGDPARPFCRSWAGGEQVASLTLSADALNLGGDGATAAAVAEMVNAFNELIATHTHPVQVNTGSGTGAASPSPQLAKPPDVSATRARVL